MASTTMRAALAGLAVAVGLALGGCASDGTIFIPYVTSRTKKIEIKPIVDESRSRLTVGAGSLALAVSPTDAPPVADLRVKVRFHRQVGAITEMHEDVWAEPVTEGVYAVATTFNEAGLWRADVLALTPDGRRGEAQVFFTVASAAAR